MEKIWDSLYVEMMKRVQIPPEEWEYFRALTSRRAIAKGSHFIQAGEEADSIGFCVGGLFRLYYTTPDGVEFNKSFCTKNDFVTSYSSLLQEVPSYFSIQALADSELIAFRYRELQALYDRHVCWERLGRIIAEHMFMNKETRERELLLLSAEDRYRLFQQRFGHLSHLIPQYHIASYLGITAVALSRIRRRLT
ncbi:Crp/Fnr family transcriptional regulator [Paenibacillus puerhi]|uniref:Crp/Fnr family transcriptional regulator n=1 Tax=Paenibacillus puerhi TaxID=2692622 RepID=UPI001356EC5C|nr:Crp/Fnr family transcriptional regulator [Paenibacillus puerhi]